MSTALPPESYIYQGVWTNWVKGGKILGATLTVDPSTASVLSPALALIITIAGSQLWRLFQFALHQSRATKHEKNFLYHQQQITLRNTATDLNTLWRLIRLAFAWRHHTDVKVFWQSLPLISWTSLHLILVIMFGLFSSWLLQATDLVLSRSPWCGTYTTAFLDAAYSGDWNSSDAVSTAFEYSNHANSRFALVQQHIDLCSNSADDCYTTPVSKLPYTSTVKSGHCPFDNSVCHPINETIVFDTGYLSSATHLGFNSAPQDRISFRLVAECAPLDDAKYVTGWQHVNATPELPGRQVSDAHYGPAPDSARNATFSFTRQYMECEQRAIVPPYALNSEWCQPGPNGASTFDPIPELRLTDADTSLIMLMVNSVFDSPVLDPWFTSRLATEDTDVYCLKGNETMYTRETPLTTLGCKQQWQICNTDSHSGADSTHCTTLQGIEQMTETFSTPGQFTNPYNSKQLATANRVIKAATESSFYYLVYALNQSNGAPLKARSLIAGTSGVSPPDTQWQTETKYWMDILLSYLQQNSMDYSTGQFSSNTRYINATTPTSDPTGSAYSICQNQLIRNTVYRNFNFFALILCVVICTIITVLGLTVEDLIGYVRQHRLTDAVSQDKKDMWTINSDLEMLGALIEHKKKIPWTRSPFGIPFAPVGAKAGIDDLRSDILEAKAGHGIINKNVERRRTATTVAFSPQTRRAHSYGLHSGHKSCATCETFEVSPSTEHNSSDGSLPADPIVQHNQPSSLHFSNDISVQMAQSDMPLLPLSAQPPQQSQKSLANGYETVNPDERDEQQNSGHDTLIRTRDYHAQSRHESGINNRDDRTGSIWPWSRQDTSSRTIC